jgi:hypothetical protein
LFILTRGYKGDGSLYKVGSDGGERKQCMMNALGQDILPRFLKTAVGFALAEFVVPWLQLAFYAWAHRMGNHPSTMPLVVLCPISVAALGLDNASLIVGLLGS